MVAQGRCHTQTRKHQHDDLKNRSHSQWHPKEDEREKSISPSDATDVQGKAPDLADSYGRRQNQRERQSTWGDWERSWGKGSILPRAISRCNPIPLNIPLAWLGDGRGKDPQRRDTPPKTPAPPHTHTLTHTQEPVPPPGGTTELEGACAHGANYMTRLEQWQRMRLA